MEIIEGLPERLKYKNPVVTIGNFDGVHLGHQKIFRRVVEKARELGGTPIVITFNPHPVRVLAPERGMKMINTLSDKRELISRMGLKAIICIPFDREFAGTDPDSFIRETLLERFGVKWVIVGHSYSFGKGKRGTTALLRRRGRKYGFGVSVVRYAKVFDDIVSSSRVRSLVLRGRVCEASHMLGRAYHIEGVVVRGAGRGASILNIPTANIDSTNELIPKEGVYAVRITFMGQGSWVMGQEEALKKLVPCPRTLDPVVFDGVANLGKNPTFGDAQVSYEAHIFDFKGDLLGQRLRLHFLDRIRDEKKFPGIAELSEGIKKDIEKARSILSKRNDPLFI